MTEWTIEEYGDPDAPSLVIHEDSVNRICFMATVGSRGESAKIMANAQMIVAAPDLLEAALRLEMAELAHANCEQCNETPELAPECCESCFPLFDDARVMRRNAIAKARGRARPSAERAP